MVTWDRLKRIDVEAEYTVWRNYALAQNVHPAITSYLDIRKGDFYLVESTVDGKRFVTPRGWVDLSDMLRLYEQHDIEVDTALISQYLQDEKVSKKFASYYTLWLKYRSDYQIDKILAGKAPKEIISRAISGKFDERISFLGLLINGMLNLTDAIMEKRAVLEKLIVFLQEVRMTSATKKQSIADAMQNAIVKCQMDITQKKAGAMLSKAEENILCSAIAFLEEAQGKCEQEMDAKKAFAIVKKHFDATNNALKKEAKKASDALDHGFAFVHDAFGEEQEMLILVTELTAMETSARFIAQYGSEQYYAHNKELLFYERQQNMIAEIELLDAVDEEVEE